MLREHLRGRLAFSSVFHRAPFHYPRDIGGKKKSPNNQSTSVAPDNASGEGEGCLQPGSCPVAPTLMLPSLERFHMENRQHL